MKKKNESTFGFGDELTETENFCLSKKKESTFGFGD
jgi:hypothetical protein